MLATVFLLNCGQTKENTLPRSESTRAQAAERSEPPAVKIPKVKLAMPEKTSDSAPVPASTEKKPDSPRETDLVSLSQIDPTILIDIVFARADNPFHYRFFKENTAWLRRGTAKKLAAVQKDLRARGLRLKIWSAYRPFAVQVKMFQIVGGNSDWVSDPWHDTGKKAHVRGVAVDCTLVDKDGKELAMPTPYLDFKHSERMKQTYQNLPRKVLANRRLLLEAMTARGMEPYVGEWWHFQDERWGDYPVVAMNEFSEIHRALLTDEMLTLKTEP